MTETKLLLNDVEIADIEGSMGRLASTWSYATIGNLLKDRASLITTIESQQNEIEKLTMIHSDYRRTALERIAYQEQKIESQKEEIERRVIQAEINISLGETVINMQAEIESLKAITELAVKGLNMELDVAIASRNKYAIGRLESVFTEIARLSHE